MIINKENLHKYNRYYTYIEHLSQKKEVQTSGGLILSLLVIALFGLLALKPSFTTISQLLKEKEEATVINQKLQEKITNLNLAKKNYDQIVVAKTAIDESLPTKPELSKLITQIELLAQKSSVTLISVSFDPLNLKDDKGIGKKEAKIADANEEIFKITINGEFESLKNFVNSLQNNRRINYIEQITISEKNLNKEKPDNEKSINNTLNLTIAGKAFYK